VRDLGSLSGQTVAVHDVIGATEWWFVRRGLPHAIPDYSAREDVWTRAWPFLLLVLFVELFASFGDRFDGWAQAGVFVAGIGVLIGAFVVVNVLRGRRALRRPDDIGVAELAVFVLVPAVLPLWFTERGWSGAALMVVINLALLAIVYTVTSYGLVPALRVGFFQAFRQLRTVTQLVARGLPLLLLITAFVFLNAEMWQVAHDFSPAFFVICVGFMVLLALSFLALRVPREIDDLARFTSWDACRSLAHDSDAPIAAQLPELIGEPPEPDLSRVELANVGILLTISQAVQTLLVGAISGVFYIGFGLLAVRRDTILQWTTAAELDPILEFGFLSEDVVLTWEHLAVSGFIAAFSVLQFAVASVTDAAYRDEFYDDVAGDVRQVLAVRAIVRSVPQHAV
jgi:hypothetical protein